MQINNIPTSYRQVFFIFLLVTIPILFSAYVLFLPIGDRVNANDAKVGVGLLVLSGVLSFAVCGSMLTRRSFSISDNSLQIKHTFYSVDLNRRELKNIQISEITESISSYISTKRNGVAAFGFYSGWFNGQYGKGIFCAVSRKPIYLLEFEGHNKLSAVLLSCNVEGFQALTEWKNKL